MVNLGSLDVPAWHALVHALLLLRTGWPKHCCRCMVVDNNVNATSAIHAGGGCVHCTHTNTYLFIYFDNFDVYFTKVQCNLASENVCGDGIFILFVTSGCTNLTYVSYRIDSIIF